MTESLSNLSPTGLLFIIAMGIMTLLLPRRRAAVPILITCCYITLGQVIMIAGLHFTLMRITILFGWVRIILRKELSDIKFNATDKAIILFVICSLVTYPLLYQTSEAFINRLGLVYDVIGIYFLFRFLIIDFCDIEQVLRELIIILIPLTFVMLNEYITGRNLFSIFGGVSEFTVIREGKFRCQGPFTHPILAGTFGATIMPVFSSFLFKNGKDKILGIIGLSAATIITLLSVSSGPLIAYFFGFLGLIMWPLRRHMRPLRYFIFLFLIFMHMVMKAPVWHLMSRIADLTGGHGWYRAAVIDAAIKYFDEWWLLGTQNTAHWGLTVLPNYPTKSDITNQYIHVGIDGGIITMTLFIAIILYGFRDLGRSLRLMESQSRHLQFLSWSMGAALFAHVMNYFSVSYFDQIIVFWYLLLAMISTIVNLSQNASGKSTVPCLQEGLQSNAC